MTELNETRKNSIILDKFLPLVTMKIGLIVPSKLILNLKGSFLFPILNIKNLDGKWFRILSPLSLMVLPIVTSLLLVYSVSLLLVRPLLWLRSICLVVWVTFKDAKLLMEQ